jgi:hypothetical protein
MARKKFQIMHPSDHPEEDKRGTKYKPSSKSMVVMNADGVFFVYNGEGYYPSIKKLSDVLPKYDVVWK